MLRYWLRRAVNWLRFGVLAVSMISAAAAQQGQGSGPSFESIPGADDAAFQGALIQWLEDHEEHALPRFSELARAGNVAAQLLLAVIDKTAALQGPWLSEQSRADRIAVLRQEGGLSGQSWIIEAARTSALARHWEDLWQMDADVATAQAFAELGEARAARETLLAIVARRERGFDARTLSAAWYPPELVYLGPERMLIPDGPQPDHPGDPQWRIAGRDIAPEDRQDWLGNSPLTLGLRNICMQECGATSASCVDALYTGLSSYNGLAVLGTPVANLVSDAEFAQSARGMSTIARRIMLGASARGRSHQLAMISETDSCAADWLRAQYYSYMPRARNNGTPK